jgi:hypothetical protein
MKTSRGAAKGATAQVSMPVALVTSAGGRCDNYWQMALDEISVKSFAGTLSGIARFASKLLYCAVTVLRDRIRVPDEF